MRDTAGFPCPCRSQVAGLAFEVAGAFVGVGHVADLVVVGDMATDGERKVAQQIEGIARALDVMRSRRPLTSIIVGPRPVGKVLDAIAQVSRILAVEEAADPADLRDRLAILLPLNLPTPSPRIATSVPASTSTCRTSRSPRPWSRPPHSARTTYGCVSTMRSTRSSNPSPRTKGVPE
ncbi:hypothetical protein [Methylorubrum aminovorans]|uniref:hypothetical protein n=1 Tax=Methylorubrum aminovorans TaxID=269069 RepID=UPI0024E0AC7E|nr:hypothetical protein [Methylorubrum aminovorans]